jgi:hypothetical protein
MVDSILKKKFNTFIELGKHNATFLSLRQWIDIPIR